MYCTLADLLEQVPERTLIQLTNEELDFDSPATVKTEVVDSCIRYADELIDAHLRGRYTRRWRRYRPFCGTLPSRWCVTGSTPAARKGQSRIP